MPIMPAFTPVFSVSFLTFRSDTSFSEMVSWRFFDAINFFMTILRGPLVSTPPAGVGRGGRFGLRPRRELSAICVPHAIAARRRKSSLSQHRLDERERIIKALQDCNWNRVKAAELSGIPRRTFYRRLREYGIQ